jgi:uncharacterized Rossmann fold enzyme
VCHTRSMSRVGTRRGTEEEAIKSRKLYVTKAMIRHLTEEQDE